MYPTISASRNLIMEIMKNRYKDVWMKCSLHCIADYSIKSCIHQKIRHLRKFSWKKILFIDVDIYNSEDNNILYNNNISQ